MALSIRKNEIFRYLGYKRGEHDAETEQLVDEITEALTAAVKPKSLYKEFSLEIADGVITIGGGMSVRSKGLLANLGGCDSVLLFAATLGAEADALVRRLEVTSMARAAVAQAVCTELIEAYCNEIIGGIKAAQAERGYYLKPRFSAGYGDFDLSHQRDFFRLLEISKRLGVCLNEQLLMTPTKSVTAVIGLTKNNDECNINKCRSCNKKDCDFRNEF